MSAPNIPQLKEELRSLVAAWEKEAVACENEFYNPSGSLEECARRLEAVIDEYFEKEDEGRISE